MCVCVCVDDPASTVLIQEGTPHQVANLIYPFLCVFVCVDVCVSVCVVVRVRMCMCMYVCVCMHACVRASVHLFSEEKQWADMRTNHFFVVEARFKSFRPSSCSLSVCSWQAYYTCVNVMCKQQLGNTLVEAVSLHVYIQELCASRWPHDDTHFAHHFRTRAKFCSLELCPAQE